MVDIIFGFLCSLGQPIVFYFCWTVLILLMGIYVYSTTLIIIFLILYLWFFWGSSLVSRFWIFVLILQNAITNHLRNVHSWPEIKSWAFGVGAMTPRLQATRELLTLEIIKYWELLQRKPLKHKTWHHPTTSSTLCRAPHANNKQDKNTNPIISKQDHHLTQPCPSEAGKKKKQQLRTNLTPYESYINHRTNRRKAETKRKKEFNFEDWEKETSNKIS